MRTVIVTPWERRAAQRFNDLLESDSPPAHDEHQPLLALSQQLTHASARACNSVHMEDDFRQRLRTRLVAVASVQGIGHEAEHQLEPRRRTPAPRSSLPRRAALLSGTVAVLIGLSGVGVASNSAMPGETLYSVKRSKEAAQLALAGSDASRASLHLEFARTRLNEARSVRDNPERLNSVLDDMDADTRTAMQELGEVAAQRKSGAPLDTIDSFIGEQRSDLVGLATSMEGTSRQRAFESIGLLDQIGDRSENLRSTLSCATKSTRSDELGPLPRRCSALPSLRPGGQNVTGIDPKVSANVSPSVSPSVDPNAAQVSASPSDQEGPSASGQGTPGPSGGLLPSAKPSPSGIVDALGAIVGGIIGSVSNQ